MTWPPAPGAMVGMQRVLRRDAFLNPVEGGPVIGERPRNIHRKLTQTSPSLAGRSAASLCVGAIFLVDIVKLPLVDFGGCTQFR